MKIKLQKTVFLPAAILLCLAFMLTASPCLAGIGAWTWMSGDNETGQPGIYGTKGTPNPDNVPGARNSSVSWIDKNGGFWLFGGYGWDSAGNDSHLNDLWRYDLNIDEWAWMSGDNRTDALGVYGTKGIADSANVPGAYSSVSWIDKNGDLWIFGGYGFDAAGNEGAMNALWRYDTNTGEWTWMSGDKEKGALGIYGTKGIADPANVPGARDSGVSWIDKNGDLWLFGGYGYDSVSSNRGHLNDLWRYNIDNETWTWVNGDNIKNQPGVYGTKGLADPANVPGVFYGAMSWTDQNGNLWLFGGFGYDNDGNDGLLNALWRYDIDNETWTWVSGSDTYYQTGIYGTKGIAAPANVPGARNYSVSWTDQNGDLWLFGGIGFGSIFGSGYLNDLWRYDIITGMWTWMSGDKETDAPGVYGIRTIADPGNMPGARDSGVTWTDQNGDLWIFGGKGYDSVGTRGRLNDLWRYELPECSVDRHCDNGVYCDGEEICEANVCTTGTHPCPGDYCNETNDVCVECLADDDCFGCVCVDSLC